MWRHELALLAALAACGHVTHQWRVYDADLPILEVSDKPGPITSTAPLPPDARPVTSAFLSAAALDAGHEDQLRTLLVASHSLQEFLHKLEGAGFRVVPAK